MYLHLHMHIYMHAHLDWWQGEGMDPHKCINDSRTCNRFGMSVIRI